MLATHLSEVIRAHADELLSRQDVKDMCESVREFAPSLVEDLIPDKVPVNTLHNVLRALLHERIPVRDIVTILETLANYARHRPGHRLPGGQGARGPGPLHHRPLQRESTASCTWSRCIPRPSTC